MIGIVKAITDSYEEGAAAERARIEAEEQSARMACAEAYQVLGVLAGHAGLFDHPDVIRALDNLSAAADGRPVPHTDLLPWPKTTLPTLFKAVRGDRLPFVIDAEDGDENERTAAPDAAGEDR